MARKPKQPPEVEWIVDLDVRFTGAYALVTARTADEANEKAAAGDFSYGPDLVGASMSDWDVQGVRENN